MGIIKAFASAVGGAFADQWQEVIEADNMTDTTVCTRGVMVRRNEKRFGNKKGNSDIISNGSIIHVYPNQFMMLLDGGRVVDYTAEEGYYKVDHSSSPSLFNGQFGDSLSDMFSRIKYAGQPSKKQIVVYINLQEIKGIKFGTKSPINYFDNFYNAELFLRAHGTYSIKVTDPLRFYSEVISRTSEHVDINDINEQYLSEFLEGLQSSINRMSVDGIRISHVTSYASQVSRYMADVLDEEWKQRRGMEILSVGIANISYDEESKKLINMRNQGAMMSDPSVREGYVQGAIARGFEAAGSNASGATHGFMGMGVGMGAGGNLFGAMSANNHSEMQSRAAQQQAPTPTPAPAGGWTCSCGTVNNGKFCSNCGSKRPEEDSWTCSCGTENTGKFCSNCGTKRPEPAGGFCPNCGKPASGKFCPECGTKLP